MRRLRCHLPAESPLILALPPCILTQFGRKEGKGTLSKNPKVLEVFHVNRLEVRVYASRSDLGVGAAQAVAAQMRALLQRQSIVRMIFAAAPSQNEFLAELGSLPDLDWSRVTAFHMDEYVGLGAHAPQSFARFLRERLFEQVRPGTVHYLDGLSGPETVCRQYGAVLAEAPIDIICAGIGENGHLAFNDPPVADFSDPLTMKVVALTQESREQQVHDGCFPDLAAVPTHALTITIPVIIGAGQLHTMVPGPTKARAVRDALLEPISPACPATILRCHPSAVLYVDPDSAALFRADRRRQEGIGHAHG